MAFDHEELYRAMVPSVASMYVDGGDGGRGAESKFVYDADHVVTNGHVVIDRRNVWGPLRRRAAARGMHCRR